MARVCATVGNSGVAVGTQVAMPLMITSGCPSEVTRTAPIIHCAVTQGPFPAGGTNAHPTTEYGAAIVAIGMPDTITRALGAVGNACPPCAHITVAPMCNIGAGMFYITVNAPMFTSTDGPTRVMVAPWPLLM
jgi:hypothetical protein